MPRACLESGMWAAPKRLSEIIPTSGRSSAEPRGRFPLLQRERRTLRVVADGNLYTVRQHQRVEHQAARCPDRGDGRLERVDPKMKQPVRVNTGAPGDDRHC